jgi:hypothetical protein
VRKHSQKTQKRSASSRRRTFISLCVAVGILAIAAVTVVSKQSLPASQSDQAGNAAAVTGAYVQPGNQTGTDQRSQQDAERLAQGLKQVINHSTEGLTEVRHADGSVSLNLEGHFQNVTVAKVNSLGRLTQSCVDNPHAAGAFFGIDPKLIDNRQRTSVAPVRE